MSKDKTYQIKLIISTPIEDSTVINEMVLQAVLDTGCRVEFMCLGSCFTNDLLSEYWGYEIQQMIIPTDEEK